MATTPVNPGTVDWTGENPGIYLKETADGPYTCLASFFRVFYSPHGPGHALFLLWDAQSEHPYNACYSDNERLAEYLRDESLVHFTTFRGNPLLDGLPLRRAFPEFLRIAGEHLDDVFRAAPDAACKIAGAKARQDRALDDDARNRVRERSF